MGCFFSSTVLHDSGLFDLPLFNFQLLSILFFSLSPWATCLCVLPFFSLHVREMHTCEIAIVTPPPPLPDDSPCYGMTFNTYSIHRLTRGSLSTDSESVRTPYIGPPESLSTHTESDIRRAKGTRLQGQHFPALKNFPYQFAS